MQCCCCEIIYVSFCVVFVGGGGVAFAIGVS